MEWIKTQFKFLEEGINLQKKEIYYHGKIDCDFLFLIRTRIEVLQVYWKTKQISSYDEYTIYISSVGGDLQTVLATQSYFKQIKEEKGIKINIVAEDRCYSAALIFLLIATGKRSARKNTLFMYHDFTLENRAISEKLIKLIENNVNLIISQTQIISKKENKDHYFSDEEAISYNVISDLI